MRELPKFGFLTSGVGFEGMKVIMLQKPYIIASVFEVKKSNVELIDDFCEEMAQGRCPIAKVREYSIFLKMFSSLEPCNDPEFQQKILHEMADFVYNERIMKNPGQFNRYDLSGKTLNERLQESRERESAKEVRLRPRRKRIED